MIRLMDDKEIIYVSYLCYMVQNYDKLNSGAIDGQQEKETKKAFEIAGIFNSMGITPNKVIGFFVQIKEVFGKKITIGNEIISKLLTLLRSEIDNKYYYINYTYYLKSKSNYKLDSFSNIDITDYNNKFKLQ